MKDWRLQRLLNVGRWDELIRRHNVDSQILANYQRLTGAVYLKGYAVECALKRIIAARIYYQSHLQAPEDQLAACFSGTLGHSLVYLFDMAFSERNPAKKRIRLAVMHFSHTWSVELRYSSKGIDRREALAILKVGDQLIALCDKEGR